MTETRTKLAELSDADFEVQKQAVLTKISEKDINLSKENQRYWGEISLHKYNFDRQAQEMEAVAKLTKQELVAHFERVFFSAETKRVDLELTSETHKEEQATVKGTNAEHELFSQVTKRVPHSDFESFKTSIEHHTDYVKASFEVFRK